MRIPSNTKIVNTIWKDHKKGLRSKTYRHSLRIKGINEEKGLVAYIKFAKVFTDKRGSFKMVWSNFTQLAYSTIKNHSSPWSI